DIPARNLAELIALAKSQPGKLSYATDTTGYIPIVGQWFNKLAGTDIVAIPYKNVSLMLQDTVAGRTQVLITSIAAMESHRRVGKLRVLGVTSPNRFPGFADVPTVAETLPGFRAGGFGILVAPTGTPADIIRTLNAAVDPLVKEPEFVQRLLSFGYTASDAGTPQSLAEFIRAEGELWDRIIKDVGIQPE
ncbi:MAG: tripartite tricarboxylate transporter substrate-binding protein, partial [Sulfuricaulis sp.]|nr:tripartite tricarboxylate transporter substrate-binding protein [Sulfuricaulis sp.]